MWLREFCRAMLLSGLTIVSYMTGDYLGDHVAKWEALLELSRTALGWVGYWFIHTMNGWFGWWFSSVVLFYAHRIFFPQLYDDEVE